MNTVPSGAEANLCFTERRRSARSKEVGPIFLHSRVLAPSRWSR